MGLTRPALACRCLTVQPPSPEDKLATLSDIAQEYQVEWDAHAAAQEMLPPPGAQPGYPGAPMVRLLCDPA